MDSSLLEGATAAVVREARGLPPAELFELYLTLHDDVPKNAHLAALALRDKARAGELDAALIPVLCACLAEDPSPQSLVHLAKAAAAFGRAAEAAAEPLATQIRALVVDDDVAYWILDGCVWSLAYCGGDAARAALEAFAAEPRSRAIASDSIYRGALTRTQRQERFAKTLAEALALATGADPGPWREKRTSMKAVKPKAPAPQGNSMLSARLRR